MTDATNPIDLVELAQELRPILDRIEGSKPERLAKALVAVTLSIEVDHVTYLAACMSAGQAITEYARSAPSLH